MGGLPDYKAVMRSLPEAVLSCDRGGMVCLTNPAAEALIGRSATELVGRHYSELFADCAELSQVVEGVMAAPAAAEPATLRLSLAGSDPPRYVDLAAAPLVSEGSVLGVVLSLREPAVWAAPGRYRELVEHAGVMILMSDGEGRVAVANRAAREFLGLGPEESLIGRSVAGAIVPQTPETASALESSLRELSEAPERYATTQQQYLQEDGTSRWIAWCNCTIPDEECGLRAVVCVGTDITQRVAAQEALRRSEQRFREMAEVTPAVFWTMSPDGRVVHFCSPAFETIYGRPVEDLYNRTVSWHSMLHPADRRRMARAASRVQEATGPVEYRICRPDGEVRWLRDHVVPVLDDAGEVDHFVGLGVDITDLKRAEEDLRASLERQRSLHAAVPGGIIVLDKDARTVEANEMAQELMGLTLEEMRGDGPADPRWHAVHPDGSPFPIHTRPALMTLRTGQPFRNVVTGFYHPSAGTYRWILVNSEPVFDPSHTTVEAVVTILTDITDRKRAEEALRDSERTAWALLNATDNPAVLLDTDFRALAANEACADSLGTGVQELLGTSIPAQMDPEAARATREQLRRVLQTGQPARWDDADEDRYITRSAYPVLDENGAVVRIALFSHDMTDRKRAEDAQRLAAVGQLAAGVAHEFNNVLAGMMATAELAGYIRTEEQYDELISTVRSGTGHGAEICRNLTAFARPNEPRRAPFELERAADVALALAAPHLGKVPIRVEKAYAARPLPVFGDAGQIEQVVLNLLINAAHAMPEGGSLAITTAYLTDAGAKPVALLGVSDTGSGIAAESLPHIFEPFFTTKGRLGESDTPGTGLGLSVSLGIVKAHGGTIDVRSQPGVGTTFEVRLPAREGLAEAVTAASDPAVNLHSEAGRGLRVLLATHEIDLGRTVARFLAGHGFQVHTASSVHQAESAMNASSLDLLIADLVIPGGGARQLIASARGLTPPVPVVLLSGEGVASVEHSTWARGAVVCLQKPFTLSEALAAVQEALGRLFTGRGTAGPA